MKGHQERLEDINSRTSFSVDNGKRVKFWKDQWCGDSTLRESFPSLYCVAMTKDA